MYLLPRPVSLAKQEDVFLLEYTAYLVLAPECSGHIYRQAVILKDAIEENTGYSLRLTKGKARKGDIFIGYRKEEQGNTAHPGEYQLSIREDGVRILGDEESVLYGIQTLIQILEQSGACLPGLEILDYPRLVNRGFYHDVTRGRMPKLSWLKKLADKMTRYKLNQLQLYVEHTYLFRDFSEVWRDETPLTPEEIMELDSYCYDRGIELVPSISTCSHMYKLLRTKQWKHLCELEEPDQEPYTAWGKMAHHTIDISNEESICMVKKMIEEYGTLFRTNKFNICADETFDLGKGKSRAVCEKYGVDTVYVNYVKELCDFVIGLGWQPMMWGDIIVKYPEYLKDFPRETVFLNWEYHPDVTERQTAVFAEKQVDFYNCSGVSGWSRLVNDYEAAFENIRRMAAYAKKYQGIGLLNTDWGDYYHTVHPEFSFLGMICGAQVSWGTDMELDEMKETISALEFGPRNKKLVDWIWKINENCLYPWIDFCRFKENRYDQEMLAEIIDRTFSDPGKPDKAAASNEVLGEIKKELSAAMAGAGRDVKERLKSYIVAIDGCRHLNCLGGVICRKEVLGESVDREACGKLAGDVELWFYYYKEMWRRIGKESELGRLQAVIDWLCDYLRTLT